MLIIKAPFQGGSLGKNEGTDKAPDGVVNELEKCYLAENFSSWRPEVKGLKLDNNNIEVSFQAIEQFIAAQEILLDESPAVFLFDMPSIWVVSSDIHGFVDNPAYQGVVFYYNLTTSR